MADIPVAEKEKIIKALQSRGATQPCPRCANHSFDLVGGYFNHFLQLDFSNINIGGPSVPVAVIACTKCGWLSEHALGTLGLLPPQAAPSPATAPTTGASPADTKGDSK